ncbi:MAG: hypothetical protein IJC61_03250 [Oscillospiraceae bacterium]|nr:hypothetical protein [Oscillospiraceae bacterium]MBQ9960176.1 hypothetical protein [Oscillospiraceae bacterium]
MVLLLRLFFAELPLLFVPLLFLLLLEAEELFLAPELLEEEFLLFLEEVLFCLLSAMFLYHLSALLFAARRKISRFAGGKLLLYIESGRRFHI